VSMFDAALRISRRQPVVKHDPKEGFPFWRSLCIGDTLEWKNNYWIVKKLPSNGQITIQPHNDARDLERTSPVFSTLFRGGARKVVVDPIGRVFRAND